MSETGAMRFFQYRQNNSGGGWDRGEQGLDVYVFIEAVDAADADARAERIGIYFNGVDAGVDCECCGDRWYPAYGEGDPEPLCYGQALETLDHGGFIHFADGRVVRVERGAVSTPLYE